MKIKFDEYSYIGGRTHNEDSLFCGEKNSKGVFIVADGCGTNGNGAVAANIVSKAIGYSLQNTVPGSWSMKRAFSIADSEIKHAQKLPGQADMKTTVAVLHIDKDSAYIAHCGDSRVYYLSGGSSPLITADHSVSYRKYLDGIISFDDIRIDEDRNCLSEAMGNPITVPTLAKKKITLKKGDGFLLCSDGFWEKLLEEEIYIDYIKSENGGRWLEFMLLRILPRLNETSDNLSAIVVMLE